jgi:hypothetical protein
VRIVVPPPAALSTLNVPPQAHRPLAHRAQPKVPRKLAPSIKANAVV